VGKLKKSRYKTKPIMQGLGIEMECVWLVQLALVLFRMTIELSYGVVFTAEHDV